MRRRSPAARFPRFTDGFTLIEMLVVITIIGAMAAIAIPRSLKQSPQTKVDHAARHLTRDLESARMRAISTKRAVETVFDANGGTYTAFLDVTEERLGMPPHTEEAVRATRLVTNARQGGVPAVRLDDAVVYGSGSASVGPRGGGIEAAVDIPSGSVIFNARGMVVTPAPDVSPGGTVYLVHESEEDAVAAVTITGAGAFRAWRFRNGSWR